MLEEEDVQELGLTIPLKAVYDEFLCPICFSPIQNCYMTPCGHHFCEGCIMECVNRKHVCPCCNANATKAQLVRNHWFDKMLAIVQQEKEEAAKKYFSKLVASSTTTPTGAGGGPDVLRSSRERPPAAGDLSPVEEVFQRHMQKGLAAYELYYQELRAKFEKAHEAARAKFAAKCLEAEREIEVTHGKGTDKAKAEWERALRALTDESDAQTRTLRQSLSDCVANLVQACDGFLKERAAVEPRLAGLLINIVVPSRGIRWERIQLRSTDAPNELFVLLEERLKAMGTPLVDVSPDAYFVLRTPLGEEVALRDRNKPLLQYDAPPGCDVELRGQVRMQGDTHECFTLRFQKGANQVENYFVCKDCKITWVCEACAKECHKGHTVVNYMPNHKPTWACCYCPKNRKCQLPNAKSTKRG